MKDEKNRKTAATALRLALRYRNQSESGLSFSFFRYSVKRFLLHYFRVALLLALINVTEAVTNNLIYEKVKDWKLGYYASIIA